MLSNSNKSADICFNLRIYSINKQRQKLIVNAKSCLFISFIVF